MAPVRIPGTTTRESDPRRPASTVFEAPACPAAARSASRSRWSERTSGKTAISQGPTSCTADTRARPLCPPFDGEPQPEAGKPDPGPAPTDTKGNHHGMPRISAPRGPGRACRPQVGICPPETAKGLSEAPARILVAGKRRPQRQDPRAIHRDSGDAEQPRRRPASPPEGTGPRAQENAWERSHHSLRVIWDSLPMDMATRQLAAVRRRTATRLKRRRSPSTPSFPAT